MSAPQKGTSNDQMDVIQVTLAATKVLGNPDKIQALVGVYQKSGISGDLVPYKFRGKIFSAAKATQSWAKGAKVYHHSTNTNFSTNSTGGTLAGFAAEDKANAVASGWVHLCPISA